MKRCVRVTVPPGCVCSWGRTRREKSPPLYKHRISVLGVSHAWWFYLYRVYIQTLEVNLSIYNETFPYNSFKFLLWVTYDILINNSNRWIRLHMFYTDLHFSQPIFCWNNTVWICAYSGWHHCWVLWSFLPGPHLLCWEEPYCGTAKYCDHLWWWKYVYGTVNW